jgi:endogenous inhibitor of DNA gyrase (YacG/DUF329 family)
MKKPYLKCMPETSKPCPICGKPAVARFRPFCSRRCKDVDLNRWLSGAYAIPVVESEDDTAPPSIVPDGHEH